MKGFIYVIRSKQTTNVYYGSTDETLDRRLQKHKAGYTMYLKGNNHYITSYELIQYDDAYIELVEIVEYEDKEELKKREGYYIQNNECVNKHIAGRIRTPKEYYEDNKEHSSLKMKKWYENNKEHALLKHKEWKEENKEYVLLKQKEYREKNRDKIREYNREYNRLRLLKKKEDLI